MRGLYGGLSLKTFNFDIISSKSSYNFLLTKASREPISESIVVLMAQRELV